MVRPHLLVTVLAGLLCLQTLQTATATDAMPEPVFKARRSLLSDDGDFILRPEVELPGQADSAFDAAAEAAAVEADPSLLFQSLGKVSPFSGDVAQEGVMRRALQARSFQKEIILFSSDADHFELTANAIMDLADLGMEHYLVFMDSAESCKYAQGLMPQMGCIWNSLFVTEHPTDFWHSIRHLWMMRWVTFARAIQEGYNPLIMDSDISVRRNPYPYLKSDVFGRFNMLVAYEQGWPGINCGTAYAQGAAADGPTAWMAAEVAERTLRWTEDATFFTDRLGTDREDATELALFEQNIFMDAACSAMNKKPVFYHSLRPWDQTQNTFYSRTAWDDLHRPLCGEIEAWDWSEFSYPEDWQCLANTERELVAWHDISVPRASDWTPELARGAAPFPAEASQYTDMFHQYMTREAAGAFATPSEVAAAPANGVVETLARAPMWLFSRWAKYGRYGQWSSCDACGSHAVMAHSVFAKGQGIEGKAAPFKINGWWHTEATALVNNGLPFHASTPEAPVPKVVAFAPQLELLFPDTDKLWGYLQDSIVKVAALTGRKIVWPLVPCESAWINLMNEDKADTLHRHPVFDVNIIASGCGNDIKCAWFSQMTPGCHEVGVSHGDFEALLGMVDESAAAPTADNTYLYKQLPAYPPVKDVWHLPFDPNPDHKMVVVSGKDLAAELEAFAEEPVLYLGATVVVDDMPLDAFMQVEEILDVCGAPVTQFPSMARSAEVAAIHEQHVAAAASLAARKSQAADREAAKAEVQFVMGDGALDVERARVEAQSGVVTERRMVLEQPTTTYVGPAGDGSGDSYPSPGGGDGYQNMIVNMATATGEMELKTRTLYTTAYVNPAGDGSGDSYPSPGGGDGYQNMIVSGMSGRMALEDEPVVQNPYYVNPTGVGGSGDSYPSPGGGDGYQNMIVNMATATGEMELKTRTLYTDQTTTLNNAGGGGDSYPSPGGGDGYNAVGGGGASQTTYTDARRMTLELMDVSEDGLCRPGCYSTTAGCYCP